MDIKDECDLCVCHVIIFKRTSESGIMFLISARVLVSIISTDFVKEVLSHHTLWGGYKPHLPTVNLSNVVAFYPTTADCSCKIWHT
jgi:hypothetical protein